LTRAGWATPSPAGGEAADAGCSDESGITGVIGGITATSTGPSGAGFTGVMGGIAAASAGLSGAGGSVAPSGIDDTGSEITDWVGRARTRAPGCREV